MHSEEELRDMKINRILQIHDDAEKDRIIQMKVEESLAAESNSQMWTGIIVLGLVIPAYGVGWVLNKIILFWMGI